MILKSYASWQIQVNSVETENRNLIVQVAHPIAKCLIFFDPDLVDANGELFCHAAVTSIGDLEALQAAGIHCNKTILGNVLFKSKEIIVLMLKVKLSKI